MARTREQLQQALADTEAWLDSLDPAAIAMPDSDGQDLRAIGDALRAVAISDVQLADRRWRVMMYPSGVMTLSQGDEILMLMAQQGFQQSSVKGIRIGSRAQDVLTQYGKPSRRLDSSHGYNWSYDAHRIAFQLRHDRVMSWLVY